MGLLKKLFGRHADVQPLPTGSLTVDRNGNVITSTVSSSYPKNLLTYIGQDVLELFRTARATQMPFSEISLNYGSLHITARELRGGAIIFLIPQTGMLPTPSTSQP